MLKKGFVRNRRPAANAVHVHHSLRRIRIGTKTDRIDSGREENALLFSNHFINRSDALAVIENNKIELPEHPEIVPIIPDFSEPTLHR